MFMKRLVGIVKAKFPFVTFTFVGHILPNYKKKIENNINLYISLFI